MVRILFVCHGNICRSPMAEFIMKDLVLKAGLSSQFEIASAATSTEEIGNPVYPPAQRKLAEHGISCSGKTARQLRSWIIPAVRERLLTPGTQGISIQPGRIFSRAVRVCSAH